VELVSEVDLVGLGGFPDASGVLVGLWGIATGKVS